jgi:hypothetical protein
MSLSKIGVTQGNDAYILVDDIGGTGYPVSKMMLGSEGSNDNLVGDSNPVPMKIRGEEFFSGATKYDAKVTSDGELATTVTERERNVYAVYHDDAIATGDTDFVLVDLDDTVNFPHADTGRIDVSVINMHLSQSTGNPDGEFIMGVITRIDGVNADICWAFGVDFNLPSNTNIRQDFNFAPSQLKFEVGVGDTTRIITNYKATNDPAFNTATPMPSPRGAATVIPAVGDVVCRLTNNAGALKFFLGVMYHGEPS